MGCVICKKYQSVSTVTVVKINLKIKLNKIVFPRSDDKYTLFLFASRDIQQHSSLNLYTDISSGATKKVSFCLSTEPTLPLYLHTWLFASCKDSDSLVNQTLLATGRILVRNLLENTAPASVNLVDIEQSKQADLIISCTNPNSLLKNNPEFAAELDVNEQRQKLLDKVSAGYNSSKVSFQKDQKFVYMDSHVGRIPLICFPILATEILVEEKRAGELLEHFRQIGMNILGLNKNVDLNSLELEVRLELVGEMLTLLSRCMLYEPDYVRTGPEQIRNVDQWVTLNNFPKLSEAGFDCEDAAKQMLELFTLFKHTKLDGFPQLKQLQELLVKYTGFLCLGKLNLDSGPTPHAYVVLLDSEYVDRLLKNKIEEKKQGWLPALALEGTNYTESVWSSRTKKDNSRLVESYKKLDSRIKTDKDSRIYRYKMPQSIVYSGKFYGPITALISGDYRGEAVHYLLGVEEKQNFVVGVNVEQLLFYDSRVTSRELLHLTLREKGFVARTLLKEFPPSYFPKAPKLLNNLKTVKHPCYFTRPIDVSDTKDEYEVTVIPVCIDSAQSNLSVSILSPV